MNREQTIELFRAILRGEVPKEALDPPSFLMQIDKAGNFGEYIDRKQVSLEEFHRERLRLHVDSFKFDIEFRNGT